MLQKYLINWCSNNVSCHPIGFQRREFPEVGVQAFFATNPYLSKIGFISGYSY
jgi:hypothetical protein